MNQHQQHAITYLVEENRVLREQIGHRRMRFTDDQRRRLAGKAKILGFKWLSQIASTSGTARFGDEFHSVARGALGHCRPGWQGGHIRTVPIGQGPKDLDNHDTKEEC